MAKNYITGKILNLFVRYILPQENPNLFDLSKNGANKYVMWILKLMMLKKSLKKKYKNIKHQQV